MDPALVRTTKPFRRAVAEFAVIVFSVMVALAADEWIDAQEGRRKAEELSVRLLEEVRTDLQSIEVRLEMSQRAEAAAARLLDSAEGLAPMPPGDSLAVLVHAVSTMPGLPRIGRTTYTEIVNTGALGLLEPGIRTAVTRYYEYADWVVRSVPPNPGTGLAPWVTALPRRFMSDPSAIEPHLLVELLLGDPNRVQEIREQFELHAEYARFDFALREEARTAAAALGGG